MLTLLMHCELDNGKLLPLYLFGLTPWLDGMTAVCRSWLSGKMKILDPHRLLWRRGKSSVIPFMIAACAEEIVSKKWFTELRHAYFNKMLTSDDGSEPRTFFFPEDDPQIAFMLRMTSITADGSCMRKELSLGAGFVWFSRCCLFCDALHGRSLLFFYFFFFIA
jgi:hypothetical protein